MSRKRTPPLQNKGTDCTAKSCPICGKAASASMAPFCSKRCADVDLHRWLGEVYVVPDGDPPPSSSFPDNEG